MTRSLAAAALLLMAALWGVTFTTVKTLLASIDAESFMFWRFLIAAIALIAAALLTRRWTPKALGPGLVLGTALVSGFWLQTRGLIETTPSRSAFVTALAVVFVPIVESLMNRAPIARRAIFGVVLAAAGLTVLFSPSAGGSPNRGDLLTLGCAFAFAIHIVLTSRFAPRVEPLSLAAVQIALVPPLMAPFSADLRNAFGVAPGTIVFVALVTTAFAFTVMIWAQRRLSATEAAVILSFEPVAAAITSVLYDIEPFTLRLVTGAGIIVVAMIVAQWNDPTSLTSTEPEIQ